MVSVGYGFGFLNKDAGPGELSDAHGHYDFVQVSYALEQPLYQKLVFLAEPFVAFVNRPVDGMDAGVGLSLKYYFSKDRKRSFFVTAGTGAAYTTVAFSEQGTHMLYILQGGVGYRWNRFFVEDRFRHYSNANTASPNRSVNANIINIGMLF